MERASSGVKAVLPISVTEADSGRIPLPESTFVWVVSLLAAVGTLVLSCLISDTQLTQGRWVAGLVSSGNTAGREEVCHTFRGQNKRGRHSQASNCLSDKPQMSAIHSRYKHRRCLTISDPKHIPHIAYQKRLLRMPIYVVNIFKAFIYISHISHKWTTSIWVQ